MSNETTQTEPSPQPAVGGPGCNEALGPLLEEAKEAGAEVTDFVNHMYIENVAVFGQEALANFVDCVRAEERERCAKLCDGVAENPAIGDEAAEVCARLIRRA